jgi:hypothetical protein
MKSHINEIGIIDKNGRKHSVNFQQGLNIVTGKSATGKSALMEIFDYCFASSENIIPAGVVTDNAELYFVTLSIDKANLVIARKQGAEGKSKAFFSSDITDEINANYFLERKNHYLRLYPDYKDQLRKYFLEAEEREKAQTKETKDTLPSIRSFSSFMLQHQNLIANKHAIFYRFDQKEKRDEVIKHIPRFLGLVDDEYLRLTSRKEQLEQDEKKINRKKEALKNLLEERKKDIEPLFHNLFFLTGIEPPKSLKIEDLCRAPAEYSVKLDELITLDKITGLSDELNNRFNKLLSQKSELESEKFRLSQHKNSLAESLKSLEQFEDSLKQNSNSQSASISNHLVCPLCESSQESSLPKSANRLREAIEKLKHDLHSVPSNKALFEKELAQFNQDIIKKGYEIRQINQEKNEIEEHINNFKDGKSQYEIVLQEKARLKAILDLLSREHQSNDSEQSVEQELKEINQKLQKYSNVKTALEKADARVNELMKEIGQNFNFEEAYKPINLKFSFKTFDLYHEKSRTEHIYLRAMGSGANWLYCHITLFLALHEYFVENKKCSIPSILFLDQPTQVYFPSLTNRNMDKEERFELEKIKTVEGKDSLDDDIQEVTNLFTQLAAYCDRLKAKHGFSPQIIVTDHVDHLTLENTDFESFVNGNRWRTGKALITFV